ncbi:MAG: bis(5'-nucleosyl)-tetraphosphatase (symmetrical) YqeK [Spirochaetota bacterium]|jgi:predicted HD superfamily hydrolase involved in NAD metabolism|nr:bis(5'-nucleosyl)-tetraphosphatase (symmetrical) YqeK [Spirochaetota bacterium]
MTRADAEQRAKEYLAGARLLHSLSVAKLAARFGAALGEDEDALYIAGALHDIAKQKPLSEQRALAERWCAEEGLPLPNNSAIYHAPASAWIVRHELNLADARIARAVARHAAGGRDMTRFEECVYAADYLDPARPFAAQAAVWPLLAVDFDEALLAMCRQTIQCVMEKRGILDPASPDYHNALVERLGKSGRTIDNLQITI